MAKSKEQRHQTEERRRRVATMLTGHATQEEIARRLEVSRQTISADVKALRKLWRKELVENPAQLKAQELAELNDMERDCMRQFSRLSDRAWIAERRMIKERKHKLLGLDAPAKQEISAPGGGPIQTDMKVILDALNDPEARDTLDALSQRLESQPSGDSG